MNKLEEFLEELKNNKKVNIEKGLENRVDIDYVIERLEDIEKETTITKMYQLVFEDAVRCYLENFDEDERVSLTDEEIKEIAYKMIYKNEYVWEIINETIDMYIRLLERESD